VNRAEVHIWYSCVIITLVLYTVVIYCTQMQGRRYNFTFEQACDYIYVLKVDDEPLTFIHDCWCQFVKHQLGLLDKHITGHW